MAFAINSTDDIGNIIAADPRVPNVTKSRLAIQAWVTAAIISEAKKFSRLHSRPTAKPIRKKPRIEILPRNAFKRPNRSPLVIKTEESDSCSHQTR